MKRALPDGYELDDDPERVDVAATHRFISEQSYWDPGRPLERHEQVLAGSARLCGLYCEAGQVGFSRTVTMEGGFFAYLADVYVLPDHRGRGLGAALVRFSVDEGPYVGSRWVLRTDDAHELYEKFGFGPPDERWMVRPEAKKPSG